MEEMTRKSNELMKLEAAKAAKEAEEAEAEAAAQHAPPPASLLASEAALEPSDLKLIEPHGLGACRSLARLPAALLAGFRGVIYLRRTGAAERCTNCFKRCMMGASRAYVES